VTFCELFRDVSLCSDTSENMSLSDEHLFCLNRPIKLYHSPSTMAQQQQPAPQQHQQLVLPTLYALLSPANYTRFVSRLSLLAVHVSPYTVRDDIYNPTNTVLPQQRTLRLRAHRRNNPPVSSKGKEKEVVIDEDDMWAYDMSYVSGLINASEYRDMEVRSYVGVGVMDPKSRLAIETFLDAMEFK